MKFIGGLLLGIGILIAGVSWLCSLLLLSEQSNWSGPAAAESLTLIGVIGGLPFLVGVGLVFLGRHLLRQAAPPPPIVAPRAEAVVVSDDDVARAKFLEQKILDVLLRRLLGEIAMLRDVFPEEHGAFFFTV